MKKILIFLFLAALLVACSGNAEGISATLTAISAAQTQIAEAFQSLTPNPTIPPPPQPATILPPATAPVSVAPAVTGAYLMAFHACNAFTTDCNDPRNHQVYLAQSDDGQNWSLVPGWQPVPGSVPDVIRRGDTIYIYASGNLIRYHVSTNIADPPLRYEAPAMTTDPSLFVDEQGRLVIFFMHGIMGGDPAQCPPGEMTCTKNFGSATEVEGSDGTRFTVDDGARVAITLGTVYRSASDPDIFSDGRDYFLYISHGSSVTVWTSPELRGTYKQLNVPPMGFFILNSGGVPSAYYNAGNGEFWSYTHVHQQVGMVIRRAVHKDFTMQLQENAWQTVISGEGIGLGQGVNVESPGFAVNAP